jgi:cell division protein FtsI/penicillin-binding protein 2
MIRRNSAKSSSSKVDSLTSRSKIVLSLIYLSFFMISIRLFYWQVIKSEALSAQAENQYSRSITLTGNRGSIFTNDGYALVENEQVYTLFAQPHVLKENPEKIVDKILPYLIEEDNQYQNASESAIASQIEAQLRESLIERLNRENRWISLKNNLSDNAKQSIEELNIFGLGFDTHYRRLYPEASMAAHITGFVGKDHDGADLGYFGIEGAMNKELKARSSNKTVLADALGLHLTDQFQNSNPIIDGRDVTLTIRRDVQNIIEAELIEAVEKYGAKSGEIIVMDPSTGKILGLAAYPNYSQSEFFKFDTSYYKNPTLSNLYEPGSTFKILTVATGIEEGVIVPETKCDKCDGPRKFGQYTIRTWNNQYTPDITIEEALRISDNVAMIFVAEKINLETWKEYLKKFGIGEKINIDLQEDHTTPFPQSWGSVRLATTSFGQGVVTNSMQLTRAVASIANQGVMMRPMIIEKVVDNNTGEIIHYYPIEERRVVSAKTANTVTKMMITSAQRGEAQWIASDQYIVAGKTGTSQVVTESGYDSKKTIASFIGFAPPEDPKFIMITKLNEPTSSPWAAETAAPLWHKIAKKLYLIFNITPTKSIESPQFDL